MPKIELDVCDFCDNILAEKKSGLVIEGENLKVTYAGRNSKDEDPFKENGQYAPLNGRVSITICWKCLDNCTGK